MAACVECTEPDIGASSIRGGSDSRQVVLLVRHGEGSHNVRGRSSWKDRCKEVDPKLTAKGEEQSRALVGHPLLASVDLVVVSPLSRAIQTAALAFGEEPQLGAVGSEAQPPSVKHRRILLTPLHTERWTAPCDEGRPKSELALDFPYIQAWEGFDALPERWWPTQATDADWADRRVPAFLRWLEDQASTCLLYTSTLPTILLV